MSYDLYCYRSTSGVPDLEEAQKTVESLNSAEEDNAVRPQSGSTKDLVVAALIQHNPKLEIFPFDYHKIAESQGISENEARSRYQHVELNPPEGDLAIQLTVYDDHVFIAAPYWYRGSDVDQLSQSLLNYAKVIRKSAGYLVYDPQTDKAFDPERTESLDCVAYNNVMARIPEIIASATKNDQKKPWWKFW